MLILLYGFASFARCWLEIVYTQAALTSAKIYNLTSKCNIVYNIYIRCVFICVFSCSFFRRWFHVVVVVIVAGIFLHLLLALLLLSHLRMRCCFDSLSILWLVVCICVYIYVVCISFNDYTICTHRSIFTAITIHKPYVIRSIVLALYCVTFSI